MKKFILALSLTLSTSLFVSAQATAVDDYKKGEVYVGYSNGQVDTGIDTGDSVADVFRERVSFNGVNVSGVYNLTRYFGIKGDVSATYNSTTFSDNFNGANVSVKSKNSLYNFLGGVQIKDNSNEGVFKPFGHVLVGAGHARAKVSDFTCSPAISCPVNPIIDEDSFSETGFAGAIGGGLDFRINNRVQIRAIQIDYNPIRANGETQNNIRIGAGIVF